MGLLEGEFNVWDLLLIPTGVFLLLGLWVVDVVYLLPFIVVCFFLLVLYSLDWSLSVSSVTRFLLLSLLHLFFREVGVRGKNKIPSSGPVLFACAPHANQFVDPVTVMSLTDRPVRFLCAAWSMRQKYIGDMARALNAIPVERAMDIAKKGKGKIIDITGNKVTGDELTDFTEYSAGWSLLVKEENLTIESIDDSHHMTLTHVLDRGDIHEHVDYHAAPRIDQGEVFQHVWNALGHGDVVGIFPEGGSHDQSAFLPFKAGVAIMGLGACAKYDQLPLKIIPVGLNYFQGHRFRSRVFLDIGDPIIPTPEQIQGYKAGGTDKKQAISSLLDCVHKSLKLVTATAPSYKLLHLLWAVRRLYTPPQVKLTVNQKLELTRRLEKYYEKMKEQPQTEQLQKRVEAYNDQLRLLGIQDNQLQHMQGISRQRVLLLLVQRMLLLLCLTLAAFPGGIFNLPIMVLAKLVSEKKAREAVVESTVKIEGKDVIATWKVMVAGALIPLCLTVYPVIAAVIGHSLYHRSFLRIWSIMSVLQVPLMYASVRFVEVGWQIARSLKPLWMELIGQEKLTALMAERAQLAKDINSMINEYGPKLWTDTDNFDAARVITLEGSANKLRRGRSANGRADTARLDKTGGATDRQREEEDEDEFTDSRWIRLRSRRELGV